MHPTLSPISRRPLRGAAVLLATAGLLAACAKAPEPVPLPEPSPTSPPACPESGLTVRAGAVDAAMGLRVMTVELVNCGTSHRTVSGYPDVRVLDGDRKPLDVTVEHGSSDVTDLKGFPTESMPVALRPGERAVAGLTWRNTVTDVTKPPANGAYLSVAPAPGAARQAVAETIDLGTTGKLTTSPWARPRSS
ncbi:DUF4232 domain-containing protein [Streptomyces sp. NPDC002537]